MPRKVGQHHGHLRRALLDAALAMVAEGDIDRLTLRGVARRAGVSPAAPYHHFADKDALLAAVAEEGFRALCAMQDGHTEPDPAARLAAMSSDYVRFALAHATHYRVMFRRTPGQIDDAVAGGLRDAASTSFATLIAAVSAANPALSADEARKRALMGWSMAHGAVGVIPWITEQDPGFDREAFITGVGQRILALALTP